MIKPIYAENIIVGIKFKNIFNWYILDKFLCLLNLEVLESNELTTYMNNKLYSAIRKNIKVINEGNKKDFVDNIEQFKTNIDELRIQILKYYEESNFDEIDDFFPTLFLDFDKNILYSQYPENIAFQNYLPNNWNFKYNDFVQLLKPEDKYWIYKNSNIFEKGIKLRKNKFEEKYDINIVLENRKKTDEKETYSMIQYKESIFSKIIRKIKELISKKY